MSRFVLDTEAADDAALAFVFDDDLDTDTIIDEYDGRTQKPEDVRSDDEIEQAVELGAWRPDQEITSNSPGPAEHITDTIAEDSNFDADSFRVIHCRLDGPVPAQARTRKLRRWLARFGIGPLLGPAHNGVRTSKYTVITFLPVNLFQQFQRTANAYFLVIAVLQMIPGLSPTPWITTVAPLVFVLLLNGAKELLDDIRRHRSDSVVNHRPVTLLRDGAEVVALWQDIRVGDVVKVEKDDDIPADVLFLAGSDKATDAAYVETSSLDGETNLKRKGCYLGTRSACTAEELRTFSRTCYLKCECPNERLYEFDGTVNKLSGQLADRLDASSLLLRGSTLRNTGWALCLVVAAGTDTKIFRNRSAAPRKVTRLERNMNVLVITMFFVLTATSAICALLDDIFMRGYGSRAWYMWTDGWWPELVPGVSSLVLQFLRYFILLDFMIPISLYVTLELVKLIQCWFLAQDRAMYDAVTDTAFAYKTTTLNEDLGQVEYVLSDKTGTLTQNVMGVVAVSIGGVLYGSVLDPESAATSNLKSQVPLPPEVCKQKQAPGDRGGPNLSAAAGPHTLAADTPLRALLRENMRAALPRGPLTEAARVARDMFFAVALCNTVQPQPSDDGSTVSYQAESPDEEALVQGASLLGFTLSARIHEKVAVEAQGATIEVAVKAVLEFSSDRKRMSVLLQLPNGCMRVVTKGADTMMLPRLAAGQEAAVEKLEGHLATMARSGFRTLVVAYRDLDASEYEAWYQSWQEAEAAGTDRAPKLAAAAAALERDLQLLGATAVEDKLQEGAPSAIACLVAAGLHVWVLTGDKLETAVSVGVACRLLAPAMQAVVLRDVDFAAMGGYDAGQRLHRYMAAVEEAATADGTGAGIGLIVEGGALAVMLADVHQRGFLKLCTKCTAVICCRVSPIQKAKVALMVKAAGHNVLCIGDGANDVGMIQAAHIGIGISGREGRAAVLASDFAIAQFRFIARLLLLHGRWSYKRNAEIVHYALYKNFVYCLCNTFFGFVSGFSAQPIFNAALMTTFSICWTSWPSVGYAAFEQDIAATTVAAHPQLYQETVRVSRTSFVLTTLRWCAEAVWHSGVIMLVALLTMWAPDSHGKSSGDMAAFGSVAYSVIIIIVNLKVALRSSFLGWPAFWMIGVLSIGCYFPFLWVISSSLKATGGVDADMIGVAHQLFRDARFWLALVLATCTALEVDLVVAAIMRHVAPADHQLLQEQRIIENVGGDVEVEALLPAPQRSDMTALHRRDLLQTGQSGQSGGRSGAALPLVAELLQTPG